MTRHHANHILLTRNLPFDSDVGQSSHPAMILLHCLWTKSNNRTLGQFECDMTLFLFCFCFALFIPIHGAIVVLSFVYVFKMCK